MKRFASTPMRFTMHSSMLFSMQIFVIVMNEDGSRILFERKGDYSNRFILIPNSNNSSNADGCQPDELDSVPRSLWTRL